MAVGTRVRVQSQRDSSGWCEGTGSVEVLCHWQRSDDGVSGVAQFLRLVITEACELLVLS